MAEITHSSVQVTTLQSAVAIGNPTTVATLPAVAAGKWLVMVTAGIGGSSVSRQFASWTAHGATPTQFPGSFAIVEPRSSNSAILHMYSFMTVWDSPGGEDIVFQIWPLSPSTAYADSITIFAMLLDDLDPADWAFAESTAAFDLLTGIVSEPLQDFADVTINVPVGGEDWLILGSGSHDVNLTNGVISWRINHNNGVGVEPWFYQEGENTIEQHCWGLSRAYALSEGAHKFQMEAFQGSSFTPFNSHIRSAVFALRLPAFEYYSFDWVSGSIDISQLQLNALTSTTHNLTGKTAADHLIIANAALESKTSHAGVLSYIEIDSAVTPLGTDDVFLGSVFDNIDHSPMFALALPDSSVMTAASHTIENIAGGGGGSVGVNIGWNRSLTAISLNLSGAAGAQILTPSPVTLSFTSPAPTTTVGATTLSPSPIALSFFSPPVSISTGPVTLSPAPITLSFTPPAPSITVGVATLSPDPIILSFSIPSVLLDTVGGPQTLSPASVTLAFSVVDPSLTVGAITLSPSPITALFTVPTPSALTAPVTLSPSPIVLSYVLPSSSLSVGAITISPNPVVGTFIVPLAVISQIELFDLAGDWVWRVNPATDHPSNAVFYLEVVIRTSDVFYPAEARLYNISDGLVVAGTEVSTTETVPPKFLRSGAVALSSLPQVEKDYRVQFGGGIGATYTWHGSRIRIVSNIP